MIDRLEATLKRYNEIISELSTPEVIQDIKKMTELSREQTRLTETVELYKKYKKLVDNIATKVKAHSNLFIIIVTILFAVLTSVTGLIGAILVFVPFVAAIILAMGHDKLVAISSTVVSMLVGFIGGIYITFRNPNSYYGYSATTIEGLSSLDLYSNIWAKLILLVLGVALLIFFILRYIKNVQEKKVKYELNDSNEVLVSEVKGDYKNIRTWPIVVVLSVILVILILGYLPWNTLFGIECFNKSVK